MCRGRSSTFFVRHVVNRRGQVDTGIEGSDEGVDRIWAWRSKAIGHIVSDERCLRFTLPAGFNGKGLVDLFFDVDLQPASYERIYTGQISDVYIRHPRRRLASTNWRDLASYEVFDLERL